MARSIAFTPSAWEDYLYWQTQDRRTLKRIHLLIEATVREPFAGIGKPEGLLGSYQGFWSRRIDEKNRLVYAVDDELITVIACRFHYDDK